METESNTRNCPKCKEEIKADAIFCKHCRSAVSPEKLPHGGTCPYCKEAIHPEAIRCKHCHSNLEKSEPAAGGCGCGQTAARAGQPRTTIRRVGVLDPTGPTSGDCYEFCTTFCF